VIVVDDGSTDGSIERASLDPAVHRITHAVNRGKGEALKSGFREARRLSFDAVVMLDADGQHDPGLISRFVQAAQASGADVIVGSRMRDTRGMPWLRRCTNRTTSYLVSRLAGQPIEDSQSGYRLLRSNVLEALDLRTSRYDTESEMLVQAGRAGFRIDHVAIPTVYADERSSIRPLADTWRFIRLFFRSVRT